MQRPIDKSDRSDEQAMVRRLKCEGARERSKGSQLLCDRIMEAVDDRRECHSAHQTAVVRPRSLRRAWTVLGTATVAASLLVGLGLLGSVEPRKETATTQAGKGRGDAGSKPPLFGLEAEAKPVVQSADYVTSTTDVAVESWTTLQQSVNPLEELDHDALLAGQMALATLPLSALETD
ncbi:MAG: hypothetical protein K8T91_20865 [Planctomycetes bacterium]|nr:hypothetical protein [Planctomycetota bacterium]